MELDVYLDHPGMYLDSERPIGRLSRGSTRALTFKYDPEYVGWDGARPLSLSLPLRQQFYDDPFCRPFFENILPEGNRRIDLFDRHRLAVDDVAGLLAVIGRDCPGAISVVPAGERPTKVPGDIRTDYRPIFPEQLAEDVEALIRGRIPRTPVRFSLAGVQSKLAVTVDPDHTDRFLEAATERHVPSTHLLKVANRDLPSLVENEYLCMKTAAGLGFEVAEVQLRSIGGRSALLVNRFDRLVVERRQVLRLHQEDGCQALGILSANKYQTGPSPSDPDQPDELGLPLNTPSWRSLAELAPDTDVPAQTRGFFVRTAALNFLLGNDDGHSKNLSFLHDRPRPRPAPLYDLVCTARYPEYADAELGLWIGSARRPREVTARAFQELLRQAQLPTRVAVRWVERELKLLVERILETFHRVLLQSGILGVTALPVRDAIADRVNHLAAAFGWNIPVTTRPLGLPRRT